MSPNSFDQRGQTVNGAQFNVAGNLYTGDQAYDVRGLANPYLGLKAFTYAERDRYAGRDDDIKRALDLLTNPGKERTLLFIAGASGSGKSSFAQAGLLPAIEQHYKNQKFVVNLAAFRPGEKPVAALANALRTLELPATGIFAPLASDQSPQPTNRVQENQISVLLIDQFEELFNRSEEAEKVAIFTLLATLPPFTQLRLHIIATIRADYLPELYNHTAVYEQAKASIDLRAMNATQLELAIQRPLQVCYPHIEKRWQIALLKRLATDAAEDAAYLPLLQVTLEEIWRNGFLTADYYISLTNAIGQRADTILMNTADAVGKPIARPTQEQTAILQIFLDLVDVSLDGNQRRDVRRTRRRTDLTRGQHELEQIIDELVTARLLSTGEKPLDIGDQSIQTVDIIHESLIRNWTRLQQAIQIERERLQQRRRFELRLSEWLDRTQSNDFLLTGVYLAEAETLQGLNDVALQSSEAKAYLAQSIGQRNIIQQAELEQQRTLTIAQTKRAEAETLRAEEQARRAQAESLRAEEKAKADAERIRLFQRATIIVSILLLIVVILILVVYNRQQAAKASAQDARARALVAQAQALQQKANLLPVSMLLAIEAEKAKPSLEAEELLRQGFTLLPKVIFSTTVAAKITKVAFSPDGQWVVSADEANVVRVHNAQTGALYRSFTLSSIVRDLAFNPTDNQTLATASNDGLACLWNITTGDRRFDCIKHDRQVNRVLFSPNGKWLATASVDGKACLWAATTGQNRLCAVHGPAVDPLAFSGDSQWLASGDQRGNIQLWDIAKGQKIATAHHPPQVLAIAFSHNGKLATAGRDGMATLWAMDQSTATLQPIATFRHNGPVNNIAFSPDDKLLATVSDDKAIRLWDLANGWEKLRMQQADFVKVATFSPTGKWLATASVDHTARVWDTATGQEVARLVHDNEVRSVAFSPDGQQIATGSTDKRLKVWSLADGEQSRAEATGHIWTVAYHPKREQFVTTSDDGFSVMRWDALTGQPVDHLPHNGLMATALAFSNDGQWLATGSDDNSINIWQLADKTVISSLSYADKVEAVAIAPDGQCVASGGVNRVVQVRPLLGGHCKITRIPYRDTVTAITYSQSGQWLATASRDGRAVVQQVATQTSITVSHGGPPILAVAISPNEQLLATAGVDRTVRLWQLPTGKTSAAPLLHGDEVRTIAFSPDGQWLVTGSADGAVRIWEAQTGQEVTRLQQSAAIEAVRFSPDGKYLVTSSEKLAQVWVFQKLARLQTTELIEQICTRLTRNLTVTEWTYYFASEEYRQTCPKL